MWSGGAHREGHLDMGRGTVRCLQLGLAVGVVVRLIGDGGPDFNLAHWSSGTGLPHHRAVVDGGKGRRRCRDCERESTAMEDERVSLHRLT